MINKTELTHPTIVTAVVEGIAPKGSHWHMPHKAEPMLFMGLFLTLPVGERFRVKDIMQRVAPSYANQKVAYMLKCAVYAGVMKREEHEEIVNVNGVSHVKMVPYYYR